MIEPGQALSGAATDDRVIAAVDLGSNSFHMVVATLQHGQLVIIDRLRETVRLAQGFDPKIGLHPDSRARALDCLARFGERLREMHAENVRAAGTNTLRRARDDDNFLQAAQDALGHRIDIIAGVEEARLIYLGVAHSTPPEEGNRLVLDIGGGSTEMIIGRGMQAHTLESLGMGCVVMTERYFADGRISPAQVERARMAVRLKLRPVKAAFRKTGWQQAIGASGTIKAAALVALEAKFAGATQGLTAEHVEQMISSAIETGEIAKLNAPGLSERRAQVWPGGLVVLAELMHGLRIERLGTSEGSLREGVLYDLAGRLQHDDARVRSVLALSERYHVDTEQAARVSATAQLLFSQMPIEIPREPGLAESMLNWAAQLHEIGLTIAHANFHEHGAYMVGHADLPGFPRVEQKLLAFLIANQRKRPDDRRAKSVAAPWRQVAKMLGVILRLAVLLNRNRGDATFDVAASLVAEQSIELRFAAGWLDENPLTVADLAREADYLAAWGFSLIARDSTAG